MCNKACDIHQNQKYYISSCGQKSFDLQWLSLKHQWKITTLCVQPHAWLSTLDNGPSKVFLQVAHLKLHQTWLYLLIFAGKNSLIWFKKLLQMNIASFLLPSDRWPWQSTISYTENGMFFAEAIIFNNGYLEIVAPYPKNNNPNISASFLIIVKLFFMFCSWII